MAKNPNKPEVIIIRRRRRREPTAHGGAWKIAYADFITALMAFFLLMWLLGTANTSQLKGIAAYFNMPLRVALTGGSGTGESASVIRGGGSDVLQQNGQMHTGKMPKASSLRLVTQVQENQDHQRLEKLKAELEAQILANPALAAYQSQLLIDITHTGLRIQVVDSRKRPMFGLGSAQLEPYAQIILEDIAPTLDQLPNAVSITGHTDALTYSNQGKGFNNFDLSADRANAVRRVLVRSGLEDSKVLRVSGMGSAVLYDPSDPDSPLNRRVSIVVLSKAAADHIIVNQRLDELPVSNATQAAALLPVEAKTQAAS